MAFSHVLISRPQPEAIELVESLKGTGITPVLMPAFSFEPGFAGLDFANVWPETGRRLTIFSSPRAVEFGLRQLPAGFLDDVEIAAIGPATSDALESAGYTVTIIPQDQFNSESLLAHSTFLDAPGTAVIFAAPGGRKALLAGLQKVGWKTHMAHVYRAEPLEPSAEALAAINKSTGVLSVWTSVNALRQLKKILKPKVWKLVCQGSCIVTSNRIAKIAGEHFCGQIYVTDGPGNAHIESRILELI